MLEQLNMFQYVLMCSRFMTQHTVVELLEPLQLLDECFSILISSFCLLPSDASVFTRTELSLLRARLISGFLYL